MIEKEEFAKEKLLNNLLSTRMEFGRAKQEFKHAISNFFEDDVKYIRIKFRGNKMYVTFESFCSFSDMHLLKFCNEFGFTPLVQFQQLNGRVTVYTWEFIKILDQEGF